MLYSVRAMLTRWIFVALLSAVATLGGAEQGATVPTFAVDPAWPQPLPDFCILGAVAGVAVD